MKIILADVLARIAYYEDKLDRCNDVHAQLQKALEDFDSIQQDVKELERYYSSTEWKNDFACDENGLIPKEIKRGILSEDGIYSMLDENQFLQMRINPDGIEND